MVVLLNDAFEGIEFDEEIRVQGFDYAEIVDLDHLRVERCGDRTKVVLSQHLREWLEADCAGEAILAHERDDFLIVFNDATDATLYRLRFA